MRLLAVGVFLFLAAGSVTADNRAVAFENVNVIPMDRERVLERQTVLVRDGSIAEVGPASKVKAPKDAVRVDGKGKYLIPGLAEMHGHLPGANTTPEIIERVLFLYVANGVTTVRGMQGHPSQLAVRAGVASGDLLGPTLYLAGPALSGGSAKTADAARQMVREQKAAGYDLLKIQEGLSREVYDAIVAAANEVKIPFGGHVPNEVGVVRAIEARQSTIDHLDNYLEGLEADDSPIRNADAATRAAQLVKHLDERKIAALAKATRAAGVSVVPTMALWEAFHSADSGEALREKRPEVKYVPREWAEGYVKQKDGMAAKGNFLGLAPSLSVPETRKRILKGLRDAGVRIVFGTDSPQMFSVPGFSIHREIPILAAAGMSPYEILQSGTRNVAEYFGALTEFGTIETGKRADLVLLEANPLKDATNVARRAGVMVRGRWLPEVEIQERLAKIAGGSR